MKRLAGARKGEDVRAAADLRYAGQSFELLIPFVDPNELADAFHAEHERRYGHADPDRAVELVTLRAAAVQPGAAVRLSATGDVERSRRTIRWEGEALEATVFTGTGLPAGTTLEGPAVIEFPETTCLVPPGWSGEADDQGIVRLDDVNAAELQVAVGSLRGIAEEMGTALIHSALSPNIKERRDCSTALFDADGRLVIQAEHIPVHLGALPASVAAVRAHDVAPGEVWVLNDPFLGGSHLPDITLVSPIHVDGELLGWAASRAHHADVGGMVPASMPADSTELHQEGLILPPIKLDDALIDLIAANSRAGDERRGDLRAQLAVHRLAERRVAELAERRGADWWRTACAEVWDYAERRTRAAIEAMPDGRYAATETVEAADEDLEIRATVEIDGDRVRVDFDGTAPQHGGNLNCPLAVTVSACCFVLRVVADPDAPASGGAYAPIEVTAPEGSLVNARSPCRGRRRQRRDVEPDRRLPAARVRQGRRRARAGSGHDEQPHVRLAALHLLRDDRRRPGRIGARGRGRRPCTWRCRTRSTRRSRRSRRPIRCASSATRCGPAAAAPADTPAAMELSARLPFSSGARRRSCPIGGGTRRAARTAARTARAGAIV